MSLTQERLRDLFTYEPERGVFIRTTSRGKHRRGSILSGTSSHGYLRACIDGRQYAIHRLAFLWMTGKWPLEDVDHINGNRADNRWLNLRDVARRVNLENIRAPQASNKSSGRLGVEGRGSRFRARICVNGRVVSLGSYASDEEAYQAYLMAKRQLHEGNTL